jgi:hypothetical protein
MDMDIKTWAIEGSNRFRDVWEFNDFWKRSNTFHAFLCFVDAAEQRWGNDPAIQPMKDLRAKMIKDNDSYFNKFIGGTGVWADDYGWCGISCLAARDYLHSIGDEPGATRYLNRAEQCWEQMRTTGYDSSNDATPVPHGCGNVSPERKPAQGYGTKNTVTNANLLLLSLRLYAATKSTSYLSMAYAQYKWFDTWFALNYNSLDAGPYMRVVSLGPIYGLIHERPMAKNSYTQTDYPIWNKGWVWTGDQGLMIIALAELFLMRDDFSQFPGFDSERVCVVCKEIAVGVEKLLFGADKVLREAPFHASFDSYYAPDYVGGRGVLLRYASEKAVREVWHAPFDLEGIRATAAAVWNSRDLNNNQFASLWNEDGDGAFNKNFVEAWGTGDPSIGSWVLNPSDYFGVLQATGLDALTAAMRLG